MQNVAEMVEICVMGFLERVLGLAKELRISQRELARRIGIDPSRITEWKRRNEGEGGGKGPSLEEAVALAGALGASVAYLLGEIDQLKPESNPVLSDDEKKLLWTIRGMRLEVDEVLQRIERGGRLREVHPVPRERPLVQQDHPQPHRNGGSSKTRRRTR